MFAETLLFLTKYLYIIDLAKFPTGGSSLSASTKQIVVVFVYAASLIFLQMLNNTMQIRPQCQYI